jgi:membrane fusion protein, macrolide-specific efflux system
MAGSSAAAPQQPTTRLVAASLGTVRQNVSTTGTIEPAAQENVEFPAAGRVTSVHVAVGDTVKAGDVLGTIDSAALAATLAEAKASLASDQAKVSADETSGADSTQLQADESAVTAAQGQVNSAQAAMDGATLRSPIAGVVASVTIAVGDEVSGGSSSNAANGGTGNSGSGGGNGSNGNSGNGSSGNGSSSAPFLVIGTSSWVVDASVDDTQVGLLKVGNQAQITTDAGATIYGTVSSIGLIASSSSGSASYPVTIKVTGSPSGLHAGATATVSLIYKQLTNVLTVPTLALHTSNGQAYVNVMAGGKQVRHDVTVGIASGGVVQIVSGLSEGDQVVVTIPRAITGTTSGNGTRNRSGTGGNGGFVPGSGFIPGGGVFVNGGNGVVPKGGVASQGGG